MASNRTQTLSIRPVPRRRFSWLGAPAALAIISGLILIVQLQLKSANEVNWYADRAEQSFRSGDYQTAATCYARLVAERPDDAVMRSRFESCIKLLELAPSPP